MLLGRKTGVKYVKLKLLFPKQFYKQICINSNACFCFSYNQKSEQCFLKRQIYEDRLEENLKEDVVLTQSDIFQSGCVFNEIPNTYIENYNIECESDSDINDEGNWQAQVKLYGEWLMVSAHKL